MEKLVLIDGNSLINRAFYAMPLLVTKNGTYTNAVYGFMNMFFKMMKDVSPEYVAVAFDMKAPTFRHRMYKEYKGTRRPMPEELRPQIGLLKDVLRLMKVKIIEKEGIEADDIIGTVAKSTSIKTYIYTGDKDSFQLVDDETAVCFTKTGISETEIYDAENFREKTGITPSQIIDLKALMGDASDNIPGVEGVGKKTALGLIERFGGVDGAYENVGLLSGKLKERIINGKDICYLSKTLATIKVDCDIDCDVSEMRVSLPFSQEVRRKFVELEFKTLAQRKDLFSEDDGGSDFGRASATEERRLKKQVCVTDEEDVYNLKDKFGKRPFALVIDEKRVSLSDGEAEYDVIVKENLIDDGVSEKVAIGGVKPLLENENNVVIVFDKKRNEKMLSSRYGICVRAFCEDVSLMKYLNDFTVGEETLESVFAEYSLDNRTPAFSLYSLYLEMKEMLKTEQTEDLYYKVELPLADVLLDMETAGFKVDTESLAETGKRYAVIVSELERRIKESTGEENLNVNSPKQLGDVLFDKLKIGKGKKTKSGYSTSADVLEELKDKHPAVPLILRYRQIQKLQSTYVEGLRPLIDEKTGLIHTSFNQTVTSTGRLSSKEPNLQNIPIRDSEGRELRKFFVPKGPDRVLIDADYSQIEMRLLAGFSGCKALIDAFNSGKDVHTETASKVFGVDENEVTEEMRRNAKAVNFGVVYGISEYGLAKNIGSSAKKAREYIDSYFEKYPEVRQYLDESIRFAKENGYAKTILGRRRYIRELNSSNYNLRAFGERVAMNMPLQGSSADVIKLAMINVASRLKKEGFRSELILQVHDELIIDAFEDEADKVKEILVHEMENAVNLPVRLTVEVGVGKTWYDAK